MTNRLYNFVLIFLVFQLNLIAQESKRDSLFNSDWKFFRGKINSAEMPSFEDETWRRLDLPHDWSIEDLKKENATDNRIISGPFDSKALCGKHSGYTIGGTGWYRKHFNLSLADTNKIVYINFDGVYMNSDIWINGHHLGNHPYGYTAFGYELSPYLNYGDKENVLAVEVKNEGINSRWYSGSGIYRHVYLSIVDKIHAAQNGTFISTPFVDSLQSKVVVQVQVNNYTKKDADIDLEMAIVDVTGKIVAIKKISTRISHYVPSKVKLNFNISTPSLWTPETPSLYKAICTIQTNNMIVDKTETTFGIRLLEFDIEKGFFLNGKNVKLKGGAMHANNGPLGAAAFDRSEERRVELMKNAGFNAVRCGHNPPSTAFLNACDHLGLMVLTEAFDVWKDGWLPDDYHIYFDDWWKRDLQSMIMNDRNHPSVILRSIGNQIKEGRDSIGIALANQLADYLRSLDITRPVTINVAMSNDWYDGSPELWRNYDPLFSAVDVCGYSYQSIQYKNVHERLPDRIQFSSEIDPQSAFKNWMRATDNNYIIGNFDWTAMDFMGEVALGRNAYSSFVESDSALFPWVTSFSGDFDFCGFRKPRSYYRDILFNNNNKLSVFVETPIPSFKLENKSKWGWDDVKQSWTWPGFEGKNLTVFTYSACDSVQLYINNKFIGTKTTSRETEFKAAWQVAYIPGTLSVIGYQKGIKEAESKLITSGKASEIHLNADRQIIKADGQDLSYVTVEITDKKGVIDPQFNETINFNIEGNGSIAAVGNSNPTSLESFQQPFRKAYEGKCLVIIRSNKKSGQIILKASGKGLTSDRIVIETNVKGK
jgi:beta-galactosidase